MPVVGSDEAEDDGRRPPSRLSQLASATGSVTRAMLTPQGIRGTVIEVAWTATHVAFYPLGLVQERVALGSAHLRLDQLPPAQRGLLSHDVEAASTPIILVHGLIDNRSIFALLRRGLTRRGFDHITTLNHSPLTDDVRSVAQTLGDLQPGSGAGADAMHQHDRRQAAALPATAHTNHGAMADIHTAGGKAGIKGGEHRLKNGGVHAGHGWGWGDGCAVQRLILASGCSGG